MGRLLAIGDVHGHSRALLRLLELVQARPDDRVVLLGDYVDRGPDSHGAVEVVKSLASQSNVVALRGNHEQSMLDALTGVNALWYSWPESASTIASYRAANPDGFRASLARKHYPFLSALPMVWEADHFIFVHGGLDADRPAGLQDASTVLWKRIGEARSHQSGKVVVCGHTPSTDRLPVHLGHTIGLDTGMGYPGGRLTALDLYSGRFWQVDADGHPYGGVLTSPAVRHHRPSNSARAAPVVAARSRVGQPLYSGVPAPSTRR